MDYLNRLGKDLIWILLNAYQNRWIDFIFFMVFLEELFTKMSINWGDIFQEDRYFSKI